MRFQRALKVLFKRGQTIINIRGFDKAKWIIMEVPPGIGARLQREVRDQSNRYKLRFRGSLNSHSNTDKGGGNRRGEFNNKEDNNDNG